MAKARKDDRGRALRKGEVQRASDKRYMYTYTDPLGRRKCIYANDLAELREKEKKLIGNDSMGDNPEFQRSDQEKTGTDGRFLVMEKTLGIGTQ